MRMCSHVQSPVQAMQRIAVASNLIRELIGPFCSVLATAVLEKGFDLGQDVLPAIMHALASGPGSSMPGQGMHDNALACCHLQFAHKERMFHGLLR